MTDAAALPGYSSLTAAEWAEFRAQFPGKLHINPVDTMKAREAGYMLRTTTPQRECESDGLDLRENLREWGQAMNMVQEIEKEFDLEEGSLDFLLSGRTMSTSGGDVIGSPEPEKEPEPGVAPMPAAKAANRLARYLNRAKETPNGKVV
jgi:hypothetical protein